MNNRPNMSKLLCLAATLFLALGTAWADDQSAQEGFDYIQGKVHGRATIIGRWAMFDITGDAAEAMYYQMSAPIKKDTSCVNGPSKTFTGLHCTKYRPPKAKKDQFVCNISVNLKHGKLGNPVGFGECGEEDEDEEKSNAYWDARNNRSPRSPDSGDLD